MTVSVTFYRGQKDYVEKLNLMVSQINEDVYNSSAGVTAAIAAASAAATSASQAATSASQAATSASSASTHSTNAATYATGASVAASAASTSAASAYVSETNAGGAAIAASSFANAASVSASAANTAATSASGFSVSASASASAASVSASAAASSASLAASFIPSQAGHSGEYLTTNGTTVSWAAVAGGGLPSQGGNNGKYLKTNGTSASWEAAVSSVGLVLPSEFSVTASTVTSSGNLGAIWVTQSPNLVFATGTSAGAPSFISLAKTHLPAVSVFTDTVQTFTAGQRGAYVTLTDAATIAVNMALGNMFEVILGGNRVLGVPTNAVKGQSGQFDFRQDATGTRTLSTAWVYSIPGRTSMPALSTAKYSLDTAPYMVNEWSTSTVTITIASPGVVTWTSHGLKGGQKIQLTTTGTLPTGLTAATTYYVIPVNANTFQLATSYANAQAGTAINTTGSQSGTHTMEAKSIMLFSARDIG